MFYHLIFGLQSYLFTNFPGLQRVITRMFHSFANIYKIHYIFFSAYAVKFSTSFPVSSLLSTKYFIEPQISKQHEGCYGTATYFHVTTELPCPTSSDDFFSILE
jgi:hypothetical protein